MEGRYICFDCGKNHKTEVECCEECNGVIILRQQIPIKETENKGFQMDSYGFFRIVVDGSKSEWTHYQGISSVEIDDNLYIGVSSYFGGYLPYECVLKVEKVSD